MHFYSAYVVYFNTARNTNLTSSSSLYSNGGDIKIGLFPLLPESLVTSLASGSSIYNPLGSVETSGDTLNMGDITVKAQNWLLDPTDFTIDSSNNSTIDSALNGGTNVTITTSASGNPTVTGASATSGSYNTNTGDINVDAPLSWSSSNTLTLSAYNSINVNSTITASGGGGLTLTYNTGNLTQDYSTDTGILNFPLTSSGFTGSVQFTGTSSTGTSSGNPTGSLTINGTSYTLINSNNLSDINNNIGSYLLSGYYALATDITLPAPTTGYNTNFTPIGESTAFTGTFNGLGNTISNLTLGTSLSSEYSGKYAGLFGQVGSNGTVENVGLLNESIYDNNAYGNTGGLVGDNGGTVADSYSTGSVYGTAGYVGGLMGVNTGTVSDSYSTGNVSGTNYVGGLVGYNSSGTVTDSYSTGSVKGTNSVGGLVGGNYGTVTDSYSTGSVSGTGYSVGGLVGVNAGTISDSYSTGSVTDTGSSGSAGGLVGYNYSGTVTDSYSTGSVTGTNSVGGLVGANSAGVSDSYSTGSVYGTGSFGSLVGVNYGTVTDSYWDTATSGQSGSSDGTGLTTSQLVSALPAGFSNTIWGDATGQTTPYLLSDSSFGTVSGYVIPYTEDSSTSPTLYGVILTPTQLQNINTTGLSNDYVLGTNINLSGASFTPIGESSPFKGTFNGLGNTISNLIIGTSGSGYSGTYAGLFGQVGSGGTVENIGLLNESIYDNNASGHTGGLVGYNYGTVSDSYSTGSVSGTGYYVGGLVGYNTNGGTVKYSYSTGSVSGGGLVGGLVGYNTNGGTVTDSYSTGSVKGTGYYVGGLVGYNTGTVSDSYSTGSVSGAGLVGGLVGYNNYGTVSDSYWDTTTSGRGSSSGGTGFTDAKMKNFAANTDWTTTNDILTELPSSFTVTTPWVQYPGETYPLLAAFMTPLTVSANTVSSTYNGSPYTAAPTGVTYKGSSTAPSSNIYGTIGYGSPTNAGTYGLTGLYSDQQGYIISYVNGTLTITAAPLTVTANNYSYTYNGKPYYGGNGVTYSGFVGGQSSSVLSGTLSYSGTSQNAVNAGTYTITPSGLTDNNYAITYANGTLTINPAPLTVTANNDSYTYNGKPYYGGNGVTYSGFVGGQSSSVLSGTLTYSGTSQGAIKAGSYTIIPQGLSDANGDYALSFVNGTLTINSAPSVTVYSDIFQAFIGSVPNGLNNANDIDNILTPILTSYEGSGSLPNIPPLWKGGKIINELYNNGFNSKYNYNFNYYRHKHH